MATILTNISKCGVMNILTGGLRFFATFLYITMATPQHIWLLRGYAGSGKDTVANIMMNLLGHQQTCIGAFASAVKDEVAAMYEFDRATLDDPVQKNRHVKLANGRIATIRDLIIDHAEGEKQITGDPAVWAYRVFPKEGIQHWILSDWRFKEEYQALRVRFPKARFHTVHIQRPSVEPLASYTEHELDGTPTNAVIENVGSLLYLGSQVQSILDSCLYADQSS